MIRLLLVEDQALIRRGIADMINMTNDIRVVAEAEDGDQALGLMRQGGVEIALMDIMLPKRTAVEVLEQLREEGTMAPPTLLLTTFDDDETLLRGVRAGARGYLLKGASFDDLADGIRAVARGETRIRPAITDRVRRLVQDQPLPFPSPVLLESLTKREGEILRLMAGGFSNKEIGDALEMGEGTVRNHASAVFGKLGVRDRTRAVLKGIELGLI